MRRIIGRRSLNLNKVKPTAPTVIQNVLEQGALQILRLPSSFTQLTMNQHITKLIEKLKATAAEKQFVYLAMNQVSEFQSCFVINKKAKENEWQSPTYSKKEDFQVYVNPVIKKLITPPQSVKEKCVSFPLIEVLADRSTKIEVSYSTLIEEGESKKSSKKQVVEELEGFKAILFQHCFDHTKGGTLLDWKLNKGRFNINGFQKEFDNTKYLLREYGIRIKNAIANNSVDSEASLKIKKDYQKRICKAFAEEARFYKQTLLKRQGRKML